MTNSKKKQIYFFVQHNTKGFLKISIWEKWVKKGTPVIQKIVAMDREQTGTCHFTMAAESFWPGHLYFLLSKKSPYTETISRGYFKWKELQKKLINDKYLLILLLCFQHIENEGNWFAGKMDQNIQPRNDGMLIEEQKQNRKPSNNSQEFN